MQGLPWASSASEVYWPTVPVASTVSIVQTSPDLLAHLRSPLVAS